MDHLIAYWYFHLPNYLLAVIGYTLIARFALGFFVQPDWDNYIWRFFCRLTNPALAATRWITPLYLGGIVLPLVAAFWTFLFRYALFAALLKAGLAPNLQGATT